MQMKPEWFDEWVIAEPDNWHLKENAPEDIKEKFEEFVKGDIRMDDDEL